MLEDWQAKWKKRKVSKNLISIDKKIYKAKRKKMEEKRREDRIRREKTRQVERKEKKR